MNKETQFVKFREWWKKHRHSGFLEDDEHFYMWGITPSEAWQCDRYRAEYSSDTGTPYMRPRVQGRKLPPYSMEEIERWAREQKIRDEIVEKFKGEHSGREEPTIEEAQAIILDALVLMRERFAARSKDARQYPEPKYWDKEVKDIETMSSEEINERRSKLANQADAIKAKYGKEI
jgi:hypothetical protein